MRLNFSTFFCALSAMASANLSAFADSPPVSAQVSVSPCEASTPVYVSYATAVKISGGKSFLVAGAPDVPSSSKICAQIVTPVRAPLKLVAVDYTMGLAAYELPANWNSTIYSLQMPATEFFDSSFTPMGTITSMQFSNRHFFPISPNQNDSYLEIMPISGKNQEFFHAIGAPLGSATKLGAVLSEQTVITLPGQPAKVFRDRDLSRLSITPFIYYRIAFSPVTIATWLENLRAGAKPELTLLSPTVNSKTLWNLRSHKVLEACFSAGEAPADDNVPVGGIKPEGVGGLEDALSSCRFSIEPGNQSIPGLTAHLSPGKSSRVFLAYLHSDTQLKIQSIQNVQHLLQLVNEGGWSFLAEQDFLINSPEPALRVLREKAIAACTAAVEFYQNEYGDPMILRRAFVIASLANSQDYSLISAREIEQLGKDIASDLPDYLRETDLRGNGPQSEFLLQRKALLAKFKDLHNARSQLP